MTTDRLAVHALRLLAGIFLAVSLLCLGDPRILLDGMEIGLDSPSALAEARAAYCGLFGALATLSLAGAQRATHRRLAIGTAALVLGLFTAARILSFVVDGRPNNWALANQAAEAIGFVLATWLWWSLPSER